MVKPMSIILLFLLASIGLLNAETSEIDTDSNSETPNQQQEQQIEMPKSLFYRYFFKRAFEGLGKRNLKKHLLNNNQEDSDEYFSNEYNKRAFEGLGKRIVDSDEEFFSNEYNKRAFEGLGKRAFEGLGKRSLRYRVIKKKFEGLGK